MREIFIFMDDLFFASHLFQKKLSVWMTHWLFECLLQYISEYYYVFSDLYVIYFMFFFSDG